MSNGETRRRTGRLPPIRCFPEQEAAVREEAADCAMSMGRFMLRAALGRQTRTHIDDHIVDELRCPGAQQKELFRQGGGVLQQEYATLLAEATRAIVRMAAWSLAQQVTRRFALEPCNVNRPVHHGSWSAAAGP